MIEYFRLIRIEPFGYEKLVPEEELEKYNNRIITKESFKKLGIPMDDFTFSRITGIEISARRERK